MTIHKAAAATTVGRSHHAPQEDPRLRKANTRAQGRSRRPASARPSHRGDRANVMSANGPRL
jgi:hypothetical protein